MINKSTALLSIALYISPAVATQDRAYHLEDVTREELNEALFESCKTGDFEKVQLLLNSGADPNAQANNSTPLHSAAIYCYMKTSQLLIEYGADVHALNGAGDTPLHLAVDSRFTKTVELLLEHGADIHARNNNGSTPLHQAAKEGRKESARLLLAELKLPKPKLAATEFESCDSKQQVWDLKSLALLNMCSNIEAYNEQNLRHTMQTYPTLLASYKKILPFVDLNNKKTRRLLALSEASDLAHYCDYIFIQQMKNFIDMQDAEQKTSLDRARQRNQNTCVQLLKAVKNAESFDQLPQEIQEIATCRVK